MNCPHCGHDKSRVTETRAARDGDRRIRLCRSCGRTFTTMERITIWFGPKEGWMDVTKEPPVLRAVPAPEPEQAPAPPEPEPLVAAKPARNARYQASLDEDRLVNICAEAQPLLVQWWNEARWSKHKGRATWTTAAWEASVRRVAELPPRQQIELCQAGVEHGWQALKVDYLDGPRLPATPAMTTRPMPKDPAMLAALDQWPA